MVREWDIDPKERQASTALPSRRIVLNRYAGGLESELASGRFLDTGMAIRIYMDMLFARRVEEALLDIKNHQMFQIDEDGETVQFEYGGPAHLRMGQEADAVGKVFLLSADDVIFGSHGSHVEIMAKGLAAIHQLDEGALQKRIGNYHHGQLVDIVSGHEPHVPVAVGQLGIDSYKNTALSAFTYGLIAEIFCKQPGFNRGMGGSMHAFFLPFGIGPNNAIVGSSANIAAGAAYAKLVQAYMTDSDFQRVMFNIGDGAAARGPVRETLNWAGMAQIANLWGLGPKGLPLIAHFVDNAYGMGGQTVGETGSYDRLARLFYGQRSDGYHAEGINGNDPLAVIDFYFRKFAELAESHAWPLGVVSETYRLIGHSPSDKGAYRTREELEAWKEVDPLPSYRRGLVTALKRVEGFADIEARLADIERFVDETVFAAVKLAADDHVSPHFEDCGEGLEAMMFNEGTTASVPPRIRKDVLSELQAHPTYMAIVTKSDEKGAGSLSIRDAITLAIMQRATSDARVVSWGEDVRQWGGAFKIYPGFESLLPPHRHFNSPISEGTIIGTAVGAAMMGLRPLVEIMYSDFLGCAGEELINQLAKWQGMSAGEIRLPVGVRVSVGSKYAAQHSQDLSSMLMGVPGLILGYIATPYDGRMMTTALMMQDNPFVVSESQKAYNMTTDQLVKMGMSVSSPVLEETDPGYIIGRTQTVRLASEGLAGAGKAVTLLAWGPALYTAAAAADQLERLGYAAEVINGRWFRPFDCSHVVESVQKTGKIVLVTEAPEAGSAAASVGMDIQRLAFDYLDAPVCLVGALNTITPGWKGQDVYFPQAGDILDTVHAQAMRLNGYTPGKDMSASRIQMKRSHGV